MIRSKTESIAVEFEHRENGGIVTTTKKLPKEADGKEAEWIRHHYGISTTKIIRSFSLK